MRRPRAQDTYAASLPKTTETGTTPETTCLSAAVGSRAAENSPRLRSSCIAAPGEKERVAGFIKFQFFFLSQLAQKTCLELVPVLLKHIDFARALRDSPSRLLRLRL